MKVRQVKENTDAVEGYRGRRDAYQRDYDSSVSGMGKRQSQAYQDDGGANDERHDLDPTDWYVVKDGKLFKISVYPNQEREAMSRGYSRTRDEAKAKAVDQGVAEGANDMTPNWAKYVLDQIYNSDGAVTLTDLFDEGIPGLHDMFMATAEAHGLDPEEEFEDVQHELTVELEDLIKGGHEEGVAEGFDKLSPQQKAHEYNLDAAQKEMDRRHEQGEDMTGAKIDKKTYKIVKPKQQGVAEMDAPGQIMNATGDKVTIDNKDGTQTIAPKASLTRDPTGKGFVLSKTPTAGGEKPDEPKPGETVFKPATTEGIEKMNEAIRMLRLAGLHKAADRLMEQQLFENPWEGKDPAKAQAWASMSPADQKWLGGADPTDQYILARAPNKGKAAAAPAAPAPAANQATPPPTPAQAAAPVPQKVDPNQADRDDAEQGAAMRANAAGGNSTSAATGVGDPGEEAAAELARMKQLAGTPAAQKVDPNQADQDDAAMGAAMTANAAQSAALASGAQDDATGVDKAVAANAAAPAAPTQAASPAAPAPAKAGFKADPIGQSIANQLKMTTPDAIKLFQKNNGLTADGQIGPATTKALQAAAQKMGVTTTSGVGTSTAGAGRGGQGGPTAAQLAAPRPGVNQPAPAKPAGGQAASPAAPAPTPAAAPAADAPAPSLINRFRASRGLPTSEDRQYYEELDKMLTIAKLR
jgi:hypothetical protein